MYDDFLYEKIYYQETTTMFDEARSTSNKTPIDYESIDPMEIYDVIDGVFDDTHYITEREVW